MACQLIVDDGRKEEKGNGVGGKEGADPGQVDESDDNSKTTVENSDVNERNFGSIQIETGREKKKEKKRKEKDRQDDGDEEKMKKMRENEAGKRKGNTTVYCIGG